MDFFIVSSPILLKLKMYCAFLPLIIAEIDESYTTGRLATNCYILQWAVFDIPSNRKRLKYEVITID